MNRKVFLLIPDLMSRSQIKAAFDANDGIDFIRVKNLNQLDPETFTADSILVAELDADLVLALQKDSDLIKPAQTIAFYSHVEVGLAASVGQYNFRALLIKSRFFSDVRGNLL